MSFTSALTILSAVSSFSASNRQADAISQQGEVNARISELDVRQAEISTQDQLRIRQDRLTKDLGAARASFSASGVDIGSGSPLDAQLEILARGQEDLDAIRSNGALAVYRAQLGGGFDQLAAQNQEAAARTRGNLTLFQTGLSLAREFRPATVTIEDSE